MPPPPSTRAAAFTCVAFLIVLSISPASALSSKRGFVGDGGLNGTVDVLTAASWFYDYNVVDPFRAPGGAPHPQFVPMWWCFSSAPSPAGTNLSHFMGYNEPNDRGNCNKSPHDTAVAWRTVMDTFPTSRLVSPATAGFGVFFFDDFFGNCTALYGPTGCNISVLAAHFYDCNPTSTLEYLRFLHQRYNLPIWLTEFSCGDGKEDAPMSAQLSFMSLIFPLLEAAPFVERYSWMSAHGANRSLVEAGPDGRAVLTPVGQLFNNL